MMPENHDPDRKLPEADSAKGHPMVTERRSRMDEKKTAAKIGMTVSMGALVATGLMRGRGAKTLHIWSGIALMGFSAWHYQLYQPAGRNKKR